MSPGSMRDQALATSTAASKNHLVSENQVVFRCRRKVDVLEPGLKLENQRFSALYLSSASLGRHKTAMAGKARIRLDTGLFMSCKRLQCQRKIIGAVLLDPSSPAPIHGIYMALLKSLTVKLLRKPSIRYDS